MCYKAYTHFAPPSFKEIHQLSWQARICSCIYITHHRAQGYAQRWSKRIAERLRIAQLQCPEQFWGWAQFGMPVQNSDNENQNGPQVLAILLSPWLAGKNPLPNQEQSGI